MTFNKISQEKSQKRKSLSQKMAFTFFYFVVFPCIILSLLSAFFFQKGIHSWFKDRIQVAMTSADKLSRSYVHNSLSHTQKASLIIAREIRLFKEKDPVLQNSNISDFLDLNEVIGDISSILFKKNNHQNLYQMISPIAFSKNWNRSIPHKIPLEKIKEAEKNQTAVFSQPEDNHLSVLTHIHSDIFLMVGKSLDPFIVQNLFNVKSSINSYIDDLHEEKRWFWSSIFLFLFSSSVLIGLSFWGSVYFKRDIIHPVNALLWSVQMLRAGKASLVDIDKIKTSKEFLFLMESFNKMSLDIQRQKNSLQKVNKNLCEKNIFMETVFQSVSSGVLILSEKGKIILCNTQAKNLLLHNTMIGKNIALLHAGFKSMLNKAVHKPERTHTQEIFSKKNMKTYRVHMRYNKPTHNVIVTLDDVGSLIASQKKGAFLDIARRVAHEIRNPLTPIVLSAQRLGQRYKKDVTDKETFQRCLDSIVRQSEIIGNIVKEFAYFVRMPLVQFKEIELSSLIKKMIDFQSSAYQNVSFQYRLFQCFVVCDASHIERAITNLLKNALEATEDNVDKRMIAVSIKEKKHAVQIIIKDNGMGLGAEHVLSTQEPYCSKKSQGMGLGLSIVEKVANDHGGSFMIYNNTDETGVTAIIEIAQNAEDGIKANTDFSEQSTEKL